MKHITQKGFSLTELLVVIAITGIVSTVILEFFISQQRSHVAQEDVTFLQGNVRAGMGVMSRELRMAGYDPVLTDAMVFSNPGLAQTTFRMDFNGDGDALDTGPAETVTYSLAGTDLRRNGQVMAENIAAVAFAYAYDSDGNGQLESDANGVIYAIVGANGAGPLQGDTSVPALPLPYVEHNDPLANNNWFKIAPATGAVTNTGTVARAKDIRAVKIWLLSRAGSDAQNYTNTNTYIVGTQTISPTTANLHRRHLLLETVVRCRNIGLWLASP